MQVAVPVETRPGERRVALVPDAVSRLIQARCTVTVECGAGNGAYASDEAYRRAGAEVRRGSVLDDADVVLFHVTAKGRAAATDAEITELTGGLSARVAARLAEVIDRVSAQE